MIDPSASERIAHWDEKSNDNILYSYVGGRTLWLGLEAEFGSISASSNVSVSVSLVGGRVIVEFSTKWGSVGGFGVDNVSFSGSALGTGWAV